MDKRWPYPGSRWWKFDFHTHTPASRDTYWARQSVELAPEEWLLKYMEAEIDCVAVTDHNSGAWIDQLKDAYEKMKEQASQGRGPEGFREITIFPGVEISVNGGVHVLAIFDPSASSGDIDSLLGAVNYQGTKGDSDGETTKSVAEVITAILEAGAIPIPAHVDDAKGLLRVRPGTRQIELSTHMVQQALEVEGLLALEWLDLDKPYPEAVENLAKPLTRVLGSDCHTFQGQNIPGSRFTWVKMANPTLEGLRLALLDGNGVSIWRSDETPFNPFRVPEHFILSIEVEKARVMGNGQPTIVEFSPYFNAIIGGRGTGKSTLIHAMRLVLGREKEIELLPPKSEPRERFYNFRKVAKNRNEIGALRPDTLIRVYWKHDDQITRLEWRVDEQTNKEIISVFEWREGEWHPSLSQDINPARFPIRIFSQGQIVAMVDNGRQTLLSIIDEASGVNELQQRLEDAKLEFLAQRARLREIDRKLASLPELERSLRDVNSKLETLSNTENKTILQAFERSLRQQNLVNNTLRKLHDGVNALRSMIQQLQLDDWELQHFTEADEDVLEWRKHADAILAKTKETIENAVSRLEEEIQQLEKDERLARWRERARKAIESYKQLQRELAEQGMSDPQAFERLSRLRDDLEQKINELKDLEGEREKLNERIKNQLEEIRQLRLEIMQHRREFLQNTLAQNEYVRMEIIPFGFDPDVIERSLRELLGITDGRFQSDIRDIKDGTPVGLVSEIIKAGGDVDEKLEALDRVKEKLLERSQSLGGRFRNYLEKRMEMPEFFDRIAVWFPEDDLRIEYKRDNEWHPIEKGSQGQRSAALLAFLLAFGEEPLVLDQPEDDLDNHLIYDLIVRQIRENKLRRQLIIVTHNPNVVVNGDAELVHVMDFRAGQCVVKTSGALQDQDVREEVCRVMEGGREAFARRWKRLGESV